MSNPYRGEMKTTGARKGEAMGVQNEFMPARAARITGTPNSATGGPMPPDKISKLQVLGDPFTNNQGPGYNNDTSGWVKGAGSGGEGKPGFDSKRSG